MPPLVSNADAGARAAPRWVRARSRGRPTPHGVGLVRREASV